MQQEIVGLQRGTAMVEDSCATPQPGAGDRGAPAEAASPGDTSGAVAAAADAAAAATAAAAAERCTCPVAAARQRVQEARQETEAWWRTLSNTKKLIVWRSME